MVENTYKDILIDRLAQDQYFNHSFHYLPSKKSMKALSLYLNIRSLMLDFAKDQEGVNLTDLLQDEPKPENFQSQEDYEEAVKLFKRAKAIINIGGKYKLNLKEIENITRINNVFTELIFYADSVKGKKLTTLITEKQAYQMEGNKKSLFGFLQGDKQE